MAQAHSRRAQILLLVIIPLTILAALSVLLLYDGSRPVTSENARGFTELGHLLLKKHDMDIKAAAAEPNTAPDSARVMFHKALKENPRDLRALVGMAKYHELRRDYRAALAADQRALGLDPQNLTVLIHKARCLLELKQDAQAEEILLSTRERAKGKKDARALVFIEELLGKVYIRQGKYVLAEEMLLRAVNQAEASKVAACPYAALGELYSITGRADKVVDTAIRAAEMEAHVSQMQYFAALTCFDNGHYKKAHKYIRRALALSDQPKLRELQRKIQSVLKPRPAAEEFEAALNSIEEYDFRRAGFHIDRALAAKEQSKGLVVKGFLLLLEKNYQQAGELLRRARGSDKRDGGARVGLGHLSIVRKEYASARRLLEPAVLSGDKLFGPGEDDDERQYEWLVYKMACQGMGWLMSNQNQHRTALLYFDRILNDDPRDVFALLGKGNSENALGRLDAAEKHLKQVLAIDASNQYAMAELALVHYNRGRYAAAEKLFKRALQQSRSRQQQYTCPYEGLGLVYLRAGKLDQAKTNFREAIRINPDIEFKKFNGLARIMISEGKLQKARELLLKSIQNYPYDEEARKLLGTLPPSKDHSP